MLDTSIPGADDGALGQEQLTWLDETLAGAAGRPTLLAMHHPPLRTSVPAWDDFALAASDRDALAVQVRRRPNVRRILAAHFHRPMLGELAGCPVFSAPSTYAHAQLDFTARELTVAAEPIGFAIHSLVHDDLVSYSLPVAIDS
jgi:3',5'-cyclic-AMP phosphodiesterase